MTFKVNEELAIEVIKFLLSIPTEDKEGPYSQINLGPRVVEKLRRLQHEVKGG